MSLKSQKRCSRCHVVKLRSSFRVYAYTTNQGKRMQRFDAPCIECRKEMRGPISPRRHRSHAIWLEANREKVKQQVAKHRADNRESLLISRRASEAKRRARGYNRACAESRKPIELVLELARIGSQYLDAYDGILIDKPTIDHVVPLHAGGDHVYENLCITSRRNNMSKHRTPLLIWMLRRAQAA
jgi:hypothetical protein